MRKTILTLVVVITTAVAILIACSDNKKESATKSEPSSNDSLIKRGAYLVTISGCDDCHSPKKMGPRGPELDAELRLSGYPSSRPLPTYDSNAIKKGMILFNQDLTSSAGPWGVSFAANLTSDATGAGSWPLENFIIALRKGKFKGHESGRDLLPPMPWQNFGQMTDDDLKAVHAFLKSTKPVENVVPAPRQLSEMK